MIIDVAAALADSAANQAGWGVIAAGVVGLVECAKRAGMPTRYAPALAVLLALLITWTVAGWDMTGDELTIALAIGLSACGLYSGTKTLAGN